MKNIWLVYYSRPSYDGGDQVLLACASEKLAKRVAERINAFARRLRERVEAIDVNAYGISNEEFERRWENRRTLLQRARWPLGLKRDDSDDLDFAAATRPLPLVQEVR